MSNFFLQMRWLLFRGVHRHKGREQYLDDILMALLSWPDYHHALLARAYVEEKLDTTLSELASLTKIDMRVAGVRHFCDLYCCFTPTSDRKTHRANPNLSVVLPHRVLGQLCALNKSGARPPASLHWIW